MGSIYKVLFQRKWIPQLSFIRNKHKHNITRPRLPHFERHVVEHVCTPYFLQNKPPKYLPDINSCIVKPTEKKELMDDQLLNILAKDAFEKIRTSRLIGFFHLNTFENDEMFQFRLLLKKNGMKYVYFKRAVMVKALTGTDYEPVLQLFKTPTVMATSTEVQLPKLLKISKKTNKIILMAAMFDDRLLSYSEIKHYGEYENLDTARIKLVHTLTSPSQYLIHQVNLYPNTLVQCLKQRLDKLRENSASG